MERVRATYESEGRLFESAWAHKDLGGLHGARVAKWLQFRAVEHVESTGTGRIEPRHKVAGHPLSGSSLLGDARVARNEGWCPQGCGASRADRGRVLLGSRSEEHTSE